VAVAAAGVTGAIVEVNSETDFVARNEDFQALVRSVVALAAAAGGDIERLRQSTVAATGRSVADEITHAISLIGENITVRRTAVVEVRAGLVGSYVHAALAPGLGKIGVLVGLESAGDPERLASLAKQLAMHVAAAKPDAISVDRLAASAVERERAIHAEQARASGKPEAIVDKIVDGRMRKFYQESVLLEQAFVVDPDIRVKDAIDRVAEEVGSSVAVTDFVCFTLGEGLESKPTDLAAEVAELAGQ
jgi:elongation factor Ts